MTAGRLKENLRGATQPIRFKRIARLKLTGKPDPTPIVRETDLRHVAVLVVQPKTCRDPICGFGRLDRATAPGGPS